MKWSAFLIPTVKEVPADAEIPSHQLMIRSGMIRKLASGTYTYMPLGWRSLRKAMEIVRQEMDAHGGLEVSMPILQPMELWSQTGRDVAFEEIMCSFKDRHGRMNVLAPTAEEVVTSIAAGEVNSYKQLPINLYQIGSKFRDEFRPRFGVLRSREFLMKDAYSFHATLESLDETYRLMSKAYCRIFDRCGVDYVVVEADSGAMGGSGSQEFMVTCSAGEDVIVRTADGSYGANLEKAPVDLPDVDKELETKRIGVGAMEEVSTPNVGTIEDVCAFLKTKPAEMMKTLIYANADGAVVVAVVRGDHELNEFKLTPIAGLGELELADEATIVKVSGAKVGFAGPMGMAEKVNKVVIDHAVAAMVSGVTGANKSDAHVKNVVPGRDFALSGDKVVVADIRNAMEGDTYKGQALQFSRGIEVGHVFKLGTKYSAKLGAKFLDENGAEQVCIMGCYGIGVNRILAAAIEGGYDENGIVWPISIAPFEVLVTSVNQDDDAVAGAAEKIYEQLRAAGVDVLLDDRVMRGGVKFKDADLIGVPIRITVGKRGVDNGEVEIKLRRDDRDKSENVTIDKAADRARELVTMLYGELGRESRRID
ncbi:MAG: proline--tRNA ligase [Sedimentisphaerales bacterium]|nr:proline--tRNA ligase [Sedimentisphaerales bacterium]